MRELLEFKMKFVFGFFLSLLTKKSITTKFLFVTHTGTKEWILGAKARRLSRNFTEESEVFYTTTFKKIPIAKGYFFLHQNYYAKALRYNPHLSKAKTIVMFTHPQWNKFYSKKHISYALSRAQKVVCLNNSVKLELCSIGVEKLKISCFHMASNPEMFPPKVTRVGKTVGFCCYYSDRKNPDLIYDLVTTTPEQNFILIGQNWENYPKFNDLLSRENFTYYGDKDYAEYPKLYLEMDVFVSPSILEGGPVPLLEAMLCNLVPVASNTGFCPDIINHGENGFLFDNVNDDLDTIKAMIIAALQLETNVRPFAEAHSWQNYGKKIFELYEDIPKS